MLACTSRGDHQQVKAAKISGGGALSGRDGVAVRRCMSDWVKPDGSLNDAALLRDVGDERAPILRYDAAYSDAAPIREAMRVADFVKDHWATGDASAYLHQWQFPLSETARRTLLPRGAEKPPPLPGLDRDLLEHWLERTGGHSALQYVFMGGKGTHSRLHVDPGGPDPRGNSRRLQDASGFWADRGTAARCGVDIPRATKTRGADED